MKPNLILQCSTFPVKQVRHIFPSYILHLRVQSSSLTTSLKTSTRRHSAGPVHPAVPSLSTERTFFCHSKDTASKYSIPKNIRRAGISAQVQTFSFLNISKLHHSQTLSQTHLYSFTFTNTQSTPSQSTNKPQTNPHNGGQDRWQELCPQACLRGLWLHRHVNPFARIRSDRARCTTKSRPQTRQETRKKRGLTLL